MLLDTTHILYMVITGLITAGLLVLFNYKVKTESGKFKVLKISAVLTVILHFSSLWVDFFIEDEVVGNSMLLPIYPCNVMMWLLLITAFTKKHEGFAFKALSEFVFWAGVVCGVIGIALNENYGNNPNLLDYDIFKGLISHNTMLFGCLYLKTSNIVKIRVSNVISVFFGLVLFLIDGAIINALFGLAGRDSVNSMYLLYPPFADYPFITTPLMGIAGLLIVFSISAIYERVALPENMRWNNLLKNKETRCEFFK